MYYTSKQRLQPDRVSPAERRRRGVPAPSEAHRHGQIFLFRMTKPGVTLTGEMCLWEDETPIGTGLPMLFDFLNEVRILK